MSEGLSSARERLLPVLQEGTGDECTEQREEGLEGKCGEQGLENAPRCECGLGARAGQGWGDTTAPPQGPGALGGVNSGGCSGRRWVRSSQGSVGLDEVTFKVPSILNYVTVL